MQRGIVVRHLVPYDKSVTTEGVCRTMSEPPQHARAAPTVARSVFKLLFDVDPEKVFFRSDGHPVRIFFILVCALSTVHCRSPWRSPTKRYAELALACSYVSACKSPCVVPQAGWVERADTPAFIVLQGLGVSVRHSDPVFHDAYPFHYRVLV